MAKTSAERISGPHRTTRRRAALRSARRWRAPLAGAGAVASPACRRGLDAALGDLVWWAVTGGTALAALAAFGLLLRARRDDRLATAAARDRRAPRRARPRRGAARRRRPAHRSSGTRRSASRRSSAACPSGSARPPTRPRSWPSRTGSSPESAASVEAAADKLRREGEAFQIAVARRRRRAARGERPHQRPPRAPPPPRADRRASLLRRAEGAGGLRHQRDGGAPRARRHAADPALAAQSRRPADLGERRLCPRGRGGEPGGGA